MYFEQCIKMKNECNDSFIFINLLHVKYSIYYCTQTHRCSFGKFLIFLLHQLVSGVSNFELKLNFYFYSHLKWSVRWILRPGRPAGPQMGPQLGPQDESLDRKILMKFLIIVVYNKSFISLVPTNMLIIDMFYNNAV